MAKLVESGTIDVLRIIFTEKVPARFSIRDDTYGGHLIRAEGDVNIGYHTRPLPADWRAKPEVPDRLSVTREGLTARSRELEAICGWSKAKSIFALRAPTKSIQEIKKGRRKGDLGISWERRDGGRLRKK